MSIFGFFRRRTSNESADERRSRLLAKGRVTDGIIIDTEATDDGHMLAHYCYEVHGVEFECSDMLTVEQNKDELKYAPGANVSVRYDPQNPGNAVLV